MPEFSRLTKNQIRDLSRLKDKKYRDRTDLFLVEGIKTIKELLNSPFTVDSLLVSDEFAGHDPDFASLFESDLHCPAFLISEKDLKSLSDTVTPQGAIAVCQKYNWENWFRTNELKNIVYLDRVSEPANLAAIIRNAAWFGFDGMLLSPESVDIYAPKVIRGSAGAVFNIPIWQNFDLDLNKKSIKDFYWFGADPDGEQEIHQVNYPAKTAICFGNESHGLSKDIRKHLDSTIRIPSPRAKIESLNLAIASAVIMYEMNRGRDY